MKTLAVVQARMGSTRLPGKVMKLLGNKRIIGWCTSAAMRAPGVDMVVVATSVNQENDVIEGWCHTNGVRCHRGAEDDVLDRYCSLIRSYQPNTIIRLTGDCPLVDSTVIGETLALHQASRASYTTNQWPPVWPDGLDVEAIDAQALLEAGEEATSQIDREVVTQFIWRNQSRWPSSSLSCPLPGMEKERWVLDSPEDFELLKLIVDNFPEDWQPNYLDIWHFLNEHPEYREINKKYARNERFYESIGKETSPPKDFARTKKALYRALKTIPYGSQTFSKSCYQYPRDESPLFASHGDGAYIFDVDGNRYVDLVGALLPNVLGYNDPDVNWSIRNQLNKGISFSLATELEAQLAEILCELIPCAEAVRFAKNGSDATSGAVRLARHFTGRDRIGIVAGEGYHGWHDWAVANTNRDAGVPGLVKSLTTRMPPDVETIKEELSLHKYAAVIVDPEFYDRQFLEELREECWGSKALIIFDEIRTGFRYHLGGFQEYIGVTPDLACFGKSMANGMPLSALVGKAEVMEALSEKDGPFWSGTFFGETLSLAASIATIEKMKREKVIDHLWRLGDEIGEGLWNLFGDSDVIMMDGMAPRITLDFVDDGIKKKFMHSMIAEGVLILNSNNVCYAMGANEVDRILTAYEKTIKKCGIS